MNAILLKSSFIQLSWNMRNIYMKNSYDISLIINENIFLNFTVIEHRWRNTKRYQVWWFSSWYRFPPEPWSDRCRAYWWKCYDVSMRYEEGNVSYVFKIYRHNMQFVEKLSYLSINNIFQSMHTLDFRSYIWE